MAENTENKPLNKPMRGDVKKYRVFVRNPKTGNIKKVNFGDPNMEIKRDDPERRKQFRARHNCDTAKDKTTPRYWSCKFWSKKPVSSLLKEIISPESIDIKNLYKKNELCPEVWENENKIRPEIRKALLKNALEFIKFSKIENLKYVDIILTGSMANYNWSEESDLDVHILMDFSQISDDDEFIGEFFKTKKSLWTEKLPIMIKNHDVEVYVQNVNEEHSSTGVYSLIEDKWITKPIKQMIGIDVADVQLKAADVINTIDELISSKNDQHVIKEIDRLMEKLRKMRKAGLEKEGEFSVENLVFKILRHSGYLEKLSDVKKEKLTKELSVEGVDESSIFKKTIKNTALAFGIALAAFIFDLSDYNDLINMGLPKEKIENAKKYYQTLKKEDVDNLKKKLEPLKNYLTKNSTKNEVYNI